MRAKLLAIKIELRKKMHDPIAKTGGWMKQMLQGHLNYFAISGNHPSLWWFFNKVRWLWLAALKRRSQKARLSWEKFVRLVARFFRQSRRYTLCHVTASTPKPEGGARCVSSARRDRCGGRGAILVPTATVAIAAQQVHPVVPTAHRLSRRKFPPALSRNYSLPLPW